MQLTRNIAMLLSISMSMLLAVNGEVNFVEVPYPAPSPAPSMSEKPLDWKSCMPQCIPICINVQGATQESCNSACGAGCQQLVGKSKTDRQFQIDD